MIFFLYGENTFLSHQKLEEIKNKFLREVDTQGDSLHFLDGETLTMDEFNRALAPASLFVKKRMVIIHNLFENKNEKIFDAILKYLENKINIENILVIRDKTNGKKLTKAKKLLFLFLSQNKSGKLKIFQQEFKNLNQHQTRTWIEQELQKRQKHTSLQNLIFLSNLFAGDLWRAFNEIEKISHYVEGDEIKKEDIDFLIEGGFDDNIFSFTDAIATNNKKKAMALFEDQVKTANDLYLFSMIVRQFRLLLQVKDALNRGMTKQEIIRELKLHPFVAQKTITQSAYFSFETLKNIFNFMLEMENKIKTGKSKLKIEFSLLLAMIS